MKLRAATFSEITAHLGLGRTAVRDSETQGIINHAAGLDACCLAYIRRLRARRGVKRSKMFSRYCGPTSDRARYKCKHFKL